VVVLAAAVFFPTVLPAADTDQAAELNRTGLELLRAGRLEEALSTLRRAQELDPENARVMNSLGRVLKEQGQLQEAIRAFEKAVELKPDFPGALYNLAEALAAAGELERARAVRQRAARYRKPAAPPVERSTRSSGSGEGSTGAGAEEDGPLRFAVQVAAYEDRDIAVALAKRLTTEYRYTALVDPVEVRGKTIYRVRVRVSSESEAGILAERLRREQSLNTWIVTLPP